MGSLAKIERSVWDPSARELLLLPSLLLLVVDLHELRWLIETIYGHFLPHLDGFTACCALLHK